MNNQISKILQQLKFILLGHILNPLWLPRKERRYRRFEIKYKNTKNGLKKYKGFVETLNVESDYNKKDSTESYIFSIWFQSENNAPPLIKSCFKQMKLFYGDKVKILDKENLKNWIDLPAYIWTKWETGIISDAHFSDICRIELLYRHGGIWFDATDYLTAPVPNWIMDLDLFIFSAGNNITPTTLIQSCFIKSNKNNPILGALRELIYEYWKNENKLLDYFLLHYMFRYIIENNSAAADLFSNMPNVIQDPTHVLWYKYRDNRYSPQLFKEATKDTFFQKTNFKMRSARNPIKGSIAEYIIKN